MAAGEDNVTLSSLFTSFSGSAAGARFFSRLSNQATSIGAVIMVIMLAVASCAVAASTYIASECYAWATIDGVSAELAAVVPSAAPSALFFFKNRL